MGRLRLLGHLDLTVRCQAEAASQRVDGVVPAATPTNKARTFVVTGGDAITRLDAERRCASTSPIKAA